MIHQFNIFIFQQFSGGNFSKVIILIVVHIYLPIDHRTYIFSTLPKMPYFEHASNFTTILFLTVHTSVPHGSIIIYTEYTKHLAIEILDYILYNDIHKNTRMNFVKNFIKKLVRLHTKHLQQHVLM